jgi:hypothetical protein
MQFDIGSYHVESSAVIASYGLNGDFVPQLDLSPLWSCCTMYERPVFPPQRNTEIYAAATKFALRADAA